MKLYAEITNINYDEVVELALDHIKSGKINNLPPQIAKLAGKSTPIAKKMLKALPDK